MHVHNPFYVSLEKKAAEFLMEGTHPALVSHSLIPETFQEFLIFATNK